MQRLNALRQHFCIGLRFRKNFFKFPGRDLFNPGRFRMLLTRLLIRDLPGRLLNRKRVSLGHLWNHPGFIIRNFAGDIAEDDGGERSKIEGKISFCHSACFLRLGRVAVLCGLDSPVENFLFLRAGIPDKKTEIGPAARVVNGNNTTDVLVETCVSDAAVLRQKLFE